MHDHHACRITGSLSRGRLIAGLGAAAASAALPASAQPALRFVDMHSHFYPKELNAAASAYQAKHNLGPLQADILGWTPQRSLEDMDRGGIAMSMLALASPKEVWFGIEAAAAVTLSRTCNEYAANLVRERPARFGFFASLPLPAIDPALAEIAYALDVLKADGIGLPTSFGDVWPGDKRFLAVFAELNRRKALVVFHPYAPNCCSGLLPGQNDSVLEYPFDTARAVASLLYNGVLARFRDIRWVLPHGGGALMGLSGRMARFTNLATRNAAENVPNGVDFELKRLYYDTANATSPQSMSPLLAYAGPGHVVFGSDFPYLNAKENVDGLLALNLPTATNAAIARGNVEALIPRLKG